MTLIIIAAVVVVAIAILAVFIATRPDDFSVRRTALIAAPPERIFPHLADLRAWAGWSPWEGLDPKATRTFSAASSGVGATYHWSGDRRVGEGIMTITEVRPDDALGLDIRFIKPFAATNQVRFELTPAAGGTTVSWTMRGKSTFMFKAMGLFINCDRMIGSQFEQGLAKLKQVSQSGGAAA